MMLPLDPALRIAALFRVVLCLVGAIGLFYVTVLFAEWAEDEGASRKDIWRP
jgi:hypothetical protein